MRSIKSIETFGIDEKEELWLDNNIDELKSEYWFANNAPTDIVPDDIVLDDYIDVNYESFRQYCAERYADFLSECKYGC